MSKVDPEPQPAVHLLFIFLYAFSFTTLTATLIYDIFQLLLLIISSLTTSADRKFIEKSANSWFTAGSDCEISTCSVIWDTFRK